MSDRNVIRAARARRFVLEIAVGADGTRYPVLHEVADNEAQKSLVRGMSIAGREAYWLDSEGPVACGQVLVADGAWGQPCKPERAS